MLIEIFFCGMSWVQEQFMDVEKYFSDLAREVDVAYQRANQARAVGLDHAPHVEIPLATSLAAILDWSPPAIEQG